MRINLTKLVAALQDVTPVLMTAILMLPLNAVGQSTSPSEGDLDTSFSADGKVITDFGGRSEEASAVIVQPDGKIVTVGYSQKNNSVDIAVARYRRNGSLDSSFSGDGKVRTAFGSEIAEGNAVALQPDAKIVVAGRALVGESNTDFALVRFLQDGTLDHSFGGNGKVLTDFGGVDTVGAIIIQPDGKIVVAGDSNVNDSADFAVARYLPNGDLDKQFGDDGRVLTNVTDTDRIFALALQADGKIVAAGDTSGGGRITFALARYLPDGTLDSSFGNGGKVLTDFNTTNATEAFTVAVQADGKILAGGAFDNFPFGFIWFALARYLPNGDLDASFSDDGLVTTFFDHDEAIQGLALQPDNKIVVVGHGGVLARYRNDGVLDPTFGNNGLGWVQTDFIENIGRANALAIQPADGRLVVAGSFGSFPTSDFGLARYHAISCNGVVVSRIGTAGEDTIIGTSGNDVIFAFGGNDFVDGRGGNDIICGGSGNDTLEGGGGDDVLRGGPGTDICRGEGQVFGDKASDCETVAGVP